MKTTKILALGAIFGCFSAFAQNTPRPEFEVATIRPSIQDLQAGATAGVRIDGAQVRCAALTLKDYIGMAYRIKLYQVSGPDWIPIRPVRYLRNHTCRDSRSPDAGNDAAVARGPVSDQNTSREEGLPCLCA